MFKWLDKRREKKLLQWIAEHDIKKEKYRFFFREMCFYDTIQKQKFALYDLINNIYISVIDDIIYAFIEDGGVLVYAYDKKVYQKVKQLQKQHIPYCFTENKYETKLNDLIEKRGYWYISDNGLLISGFRYTPFIIVNNLEEAQKKEMISEKIDTSYHYIWIGSDRLEEEVAECKRKGIQYRFTIQKNLIEELYGK